MVFGIRLKRAAFAHMNSPPLHGESKNIIEHALHFSPPYVFRYTSEITNHRYRGMVSAMLANNIPLN
jgi:hypothetical protein